MGAPMTNQTTPTDGNGEKELRQQILKAGTIRFASGSFTQKHFSDGTVSPIEHKVQEIVEIGLDDLMQLFHQQLEAKVAEARVELAEELLWLTGKEIKPMTLKMFKGRVERLRSHLTPNNKETA